MSNRRRRTITASLTLGALLTIAALFAAQPGWQRVSLDGADPADAGIQATAAGLLQLSPDQSGCAVAAGGLEVDGSSVSLDLYNVGSGDATLDSLELGWTGGAHLRGVTLNGQAAFTGTASSPAFVALEDAPVVAPGGVLEIGLEFTDTVEPSGLGPLIAGFVEGCMLSIGNDPAVACDLEVSPPEVPPTGPNDVRFEISNPSPNPTQIVGIRLGWPQATNGSLLSLLIEDVPVASFAPGQVTSPTYLDLRRFVGRPVMLEPDESVAVRARFEALASDVESEYVLAVDDGAGCSAGGGHKASNECAIRLVGLNATGETVQVNVVNLDEVPRTLTALEVFWPAATAGAIEEIRTEAGALLWTGEATRSPARIGLTNRLQVAAEGRVGLVLELSGSRSEGKASVAGGGDLTLVAHFSGGCQSAMTTRGSAQPGCSVSTGELTVEDQRASVPLANSTGRARLDQVRLTWPEENGPLLEIALGDTSLWSGSETQQPVSLTLPATDEAWLEQQEGRPLALVFESDASPGPYSLALSFADEEGELCDRRLVTAAPPSEAAQCALELSPPTRVASGHIEAQVTMTGRERTRLQYVRIAWPDDNRRLSAAVLRSPTLAEAPLLDREVETSPARLIPARPLYLEAGTSTIALHLTSDLAAGDLGQVGLVVVADGCQAAQSTEAPMFPVPDRFSGAIAELPNQGQLIGRWRIAVLDAGDSISREVWVDNSTRLDPPNVGPEVGDRVTVEAVRDATGRERALVIHFERAAIVELVGLISEITGQPATSIVVDNTRVHVRDAIVRGRLALDAVVRVQGMSNTDGTVTAMRVTVIDANVGEHIEFRGVIQAITDDPQTPGVQVWTVDGRQVRVLESLIENATGIEVEPGARVLINGRIQDRLVSASAPPDRVQILAPLVPVRLEGRIVSLPEGLVGTWQIETPGGQLVSVEVTSPAVVDSRRVAPEAGAQVRITGRRDGNTITALRVTTDWGE